MRLGGRLLAAGVMVLRCSALTNLDDLSGGDAGDEGGDASADGSPFASPAAWSTFDIANVAAAAGFAGAAFDGRFLYLAPVNGTVVRFDTQAAFESSASWAAAPSISSGPFAGTAFDGRYVYFIPTTGGALINDGVARYDTQAPFTSTSSWSVFHTATINANARGFWGGTFDGRYLYLAPYTNNNTGGDGIVARYDTQGPFTSAWTTFDTTTVNSGAAGFTGAIFDGRFVYFVPYANVAMPDGITARYDTLGSFDSGAAWSTFDTGGVNSLAVGFGGGGFDGRFLYLSPYANGTQDGVVTRYDTHGTFTAPGSWLTFDLSTLEPYANQSSAPAFDGRYMYFPRYTMGTGLAGAGVIARYDTLAPSLSSPAAWSTFDTTTIASSAGRYSGAAFDGEYVYFIPAAGGLIARFDAVKPRALPTLPGWNGSFF